MSKPIVIDCNKQSDGYNIRVNPLSAVSLKLDKYRPSSVFIGFDDVKIPKLSTMQWKSFCKILLNCKKIVPCVVKQASTKTVYFRWPQNK
jgi:hypothetical protein